MSQAATSSRVVPHMANSTTAPIIIMEDVNKWFGSLHVLRNVSISVAEQERVVICGPSGSGKSTMIRCLNRLESHQQGRIVIDGTELTTTFARWTPSGAKSGWYFSRSISFPI